MYRSLQKKKKDSFSGVVNMCAQNYGQYKSPTSVLHINITFSCH